MDIINSGGFLKLPFPLQVIILKEVPLPQLLFLRKSCKRMNAIITKYCFMQLELRLFGSVFVSVDFFSILRRHSLRHCPQFSIEPTNSLILDSSSQTMIESQFLAELFPNVQCLVIAQYYHKRLPQLDIKYLLQKFSPNLVNLAIYVNNSNYSRKGELY